ncbi:hypothetical protein N0V88_007519 [Collariella sp. IMI 366227]|nr:hypothetical protein N0V88_007519 [Collariella sp. IMI 366227]
MGDARETSNLTEDKTEEISQTEIMSRLQRSRMEELAAMNSTVPLDKLVVPADADIRLLMRPLSPGHMVRDPKAMPLTLRAEVTDDEEAAHRVLAVHQTRRDVNYTVNIPNYSNPHHWLSCVLFYDPTSDHQVLVNRSNVPFTLTRISLVPEERCGESYTVNPDFNKSLAPGTWRINMDGTDLLDFRIVERRQAWLRAPPSSSSSDMSVTSEGVNSLGKRSFVASDADPINPEKKRRSSQPPGNKKEDNVIMFLPNKNNQLATTSKNKALTKVTGHPLLDLLVDETLEVPDGPDLVGYTITKKEKLYASSLSSVFTAEYSGVPGQRVVCKVLRTNPAQIANNENALARNLIRQAQTWLGELERHEQFKHNSIVRLYNYDARYLSLYMEHFDGYDLKKEGVWRSTTTELFIGDRADAMRILRDITNVLHYVHAKGYVHNDLKPANILYNRERGGVLCDFGHTTQKTATSSGGTPWYIPPEFIGLKQRGCPADVWALGVVMLYVMGKLPFPESRANADHPRRVHFTIAHVNDSRRREAQSRAVTSMRQWLGEINAVRGGLDLHDKLERVVHGMLAPNPRERLTTREVLNELFVEQLMER